MRWERAWCFKHVMLLEILHREEIEEEDEDEQAEIFHDIVSFAAAVQLLKPV